jgi:hypothetical protein
VREGLQSELLRNEPPLLLFIGLITNVEWLQTPPRWSEGPTRTTTWKPLSGGHKVGSADLWGRPTPCRPPRGVLSPGGCPVGPQVSSWCPLDFEAVLVPVGPSIHVTSTCRPLIRRDVPPLDW